MKTRHFRAILVPLVAVAMAISLAGCPNLLNPNDGDPTDLNEDDPGDSNDDDPVDPDVLAEQLESLQEPPNVANGPAMSMVDTPDGEPVPMEDETDTGTVDGVPVTYYVSTQRYSAAASYDTQVLLNPSADVIYPGSVILGHTVDDGSFIEVTSGTKRDVTVSFDLTGVTDGEGNPGYVSGTITPTLSGYREFRNALLSQNIPTQTSTYSFEMTEINSSEEMDLKIAAGANFSGGVYEGSIMAGFDFTKVTTTNKVMVRFMQTFYTVDVDQGQGTFLFNDFDLDDFGGYRPVYVSSVAYGRLAYLTIESESDTSEISSNLTTAFSAPAGSGDVAVDNAFGFFRDHTTTRITVIGGSTVAITIDQFKAMLEDDTFSEDNAGQIIAYKLRFVHDNSVANTIFAGDYTARNVEMVYGGGVDVTLDIAGIACSIDDGLGSNTAELYGDLLFKLKNSNVDNLLWHYFENSPYTCPVDGTLVLDAGDTWPPITINVPSLSSEITIAIVGFWERDPWPNPDDPFSDFNESYYVSELATVQNGGAPLTVQTYWEPDGTIDDSEVVEFHIVPTVTLLFDPPQ